MHNIYLLIIAIGNGIGIEIKRKTNSNIEILNLNTQMCKAFLYDACKWYLCLNKI